MTRDSSDSEKRKRGKIHIEGQRNPFLCFVGSNLLRVYSLVYFRLIKDENVYFTYSNISFRSVKQKNYKLYEKTKEGLEGCIKPNIPFQNVDIVFYFLFVVVRRFNYPHLFEINLIHWWKSFYIIERYFCITNCDSPEGTHIFWFFSSSPNQRTLCLRVLKRVFWDWILLWSPEIVQLIGWLVSVKIRLHLYNKDHCFLLLRNSESHYLFFAILRTE